MGKNTPRNYRVNGKLTSDKNLFKQTLKKIFLFVFFHESAIRYQNTVIKGFKSKFYF